MRRPESPVPATLLAYLGVTVLAPWLRGSGGPDFAQHAATALVSAALLGGAWWGLRRLSGPGPAGPEAAGHSRARGAGPPS